MARYYNTYDFEYKCSNCGKSFETFYSNGVPALPVIDCRECKCKGTVHKVAGSNTVCTPTGGAGSVSTVSITTKTNPISNLVLDPPNIG